MMSWHMYRPIINGASFSLSVELAITLLLIHQLASAALGMLLLIVAFSYSSNSHSINSSSNNIPAVCGVWVGGVEELLLLLLLAECGVWVVVGNDGG
eukprot:scaffold27047_cov141-Skeletonema_dohrnii-CCMP3373.AAC.1